MSNPKKPANSPASQPLRFPLWRQGIHVENVILIAATAFAVGILAGRTSKVNRPLAEVSRNLPAGLRGSPAEDPHAVRERSSAQGSPALAPAGPHTLEEALAAARKEVEGVNEAGELVRLGNQAFDAAEAHGDPSLYVRAIAAYERALQLRPKDPNVQTDLGIAYRNIGQPDTAIQHFQAAQASDPHHLQSQLNLAIVYLYDKSNPGKAAEAAERCLALNPPQEIASTAQQILTEARQKLSTTNEHE